MGCLHGKHAGTAAARGGSPRKTYSWDSRRADRGRNESEYAMEGAVGGEEVRGPGSVDGNQFLVRDCKASSLYLLDHTNAVYVYDCVDCTIILGPTKGSLYIGDCVNCVCVAASGQLRIRNSRRILAFVHCETRPAIESSSGVCFGGYDLYYDRLDEHCKLANVDPRRKTWTDVHDFTPVRGEANWKFVRSGDVRDYVKEPTSDTVAVRLAECGLRWRCGANVRGGGDDACEESAAGPADGSAS